MVGQERLPIDAGLLVGSHHPRGALRSRLAHLTGRRLLLLDPLRFLRDHLSGERGRLGGDALARRRLRARALAVLRSSSMARSSSSMPLSPSSCAPPPPPDPSPPSPPSASAAAAGLTLEALAPPPPFLPPPAAAACRSACVTTFAAGLGAATSSRPRSWRKLSCSVPSDPSDNSAPSAPSDEP